MSDSLLFGQMKLPATVVADLRRMLASEIVNILLRRPETNGLMREALVAAFEGARSFAEARLLSRKIESVGNFNYEDLARLMKACEVNSQVAHAIGVPARIQVLFERVTKTVTSPR